jgi:hypothetical protein
VDGRQGTRAGALLLLRVARAGGALGAGQDAARGEDQDMAVRELLLELTREPCIEKSVMCAEEKEVRAERTNRCWTRWKP